MNGDTVSDDLKRQAAMFYNSTQREQTKELESTWCFWRRRRLVVALMAFFGFFNVYALRVNLSVAVVAMTQPVETKLENGTIVFIPEFDWSSQTKGLVLSSFFYGYLVTQLPGGWLAAKIGGNRVFAIGIGATSLLTLFTPPLAHISTALLIAVRVIEGLFEGVTYPCIHAVWSRWAPAHERARLATFAFSGSYAGTVFSMPLCSLLAHYTGWPGIFYVFGLMGLVWTTIWWLVVKESPEKDPLISPAELKYIQDSRGTQMVEGSKIRHPWKDMLKSGPVWAIVVAHFSENWGFYTLLTFLPTFMHEVFKFETSPSLTGLLSAVPYLVMAIMLQVAGHMVDWLLHTGDVFKFETSQTGWLSAVPYLVMAIVLQVAGHMADWLLHRGVMSRTNIRKLFNCGAFLAQTVFMIAAAYATTYIWCLVFLSTAVGLGGFAWSGFSVNHLDIAPPHASVLMGLSNTVATLPGIISPPLAGSIVINKTAEEWRIVFFISAFIYLVGAIVYGLLCSGERQWWVVETETDASFDTDAASVTTSPGYDNKAMDHSEI